MELVLQCCSHTSALLHCHCLLFCENFHLHVLHLEFVNKECLVLFLLHLAPLQVNLITLMFSLVHLLLHLAVLLNDRAGERLASPLVPGAYHGGLLRLHLIILILESTLVLSLLCQLLANVVDVVCKELFLFLLLALLDLGPSQHILLKVIHPGALLLLLAHHQFSIALAVKLLR